MRPRSSLTLPPPTAATLCLVPLLANPLFCPPLHSFHRTNTASNRPCLPRPPLQVVSWHQMPVRLLQAHTGFREILAFPLRCNLPSLRRTSTTVCCRYLMNLSRRSASPCCTLRTISCCPASLQHQAPSDRFRRQPLRSTAFCLKPRAGNSLASSTALHLFAK